MIEIGEEETREKNTTLLLADNIPSIFSSNIKAVAQYNNPQLAYLSIVPSWDYTASLSFFTSHCPFPFFSSTATIYYTY